jgi:hypothetical protein
MKLITEISLTKGQIVFGIVINYSIGGRSRGSEPACFPKKLRFGGNDENGLPIWEDEFFTASLSDTISSMSIHCHSNKWRRFDDENFIVAAILPEKLRMETYTDKDNPSPYHWKRNLKVTELIRTEESDY